MTPDALEPLLISIVLPTYNGARHLQASIDSCLSQTRRNLELILVDDGSPDPETGVIVERQTDERVRVLRLDKNVGLPSALNEGFRVAKGDFLTWTSDDNLYRPEALEVMAREMSGVDFVYAHCSLIDEAGAETGTIVPRGPEYLPLDNCVGACFLYTRRVLEEVGEYDPAMRLTEDYDYWIRVSKRFQMRVIDQNLYSYRHHETTLTSVHGREGVSEMIDKARRKHFAAGDFLMAEGLRAYDRDDRSEARKKLISALFRNPFCGHLYRPLVICLLPRFAVSLLVRIKSMLSHLCSSVFICGLLQ